LKQIGQQLLRIHAYDSKISIIVWALIGTHLKQYHMGAGGETAKLVDSNKMSIEMI
jgi:molybdopterin/thiamine biosynthesis adenylyltransferase